VKHMPDAVQPTHPLEYWLSQDLVKDSPPEAPSRLRQLADAQGTLAAAWSSAISGGPVLALAGGYGSALSGNPAVVIVLGLIGVALTAVGVLFWKRVHTRLPDTSKSLVTRGPGSARSGITTMAVFAGLTGAGLAADFPAAAERGTTIALIGAYLLIVALLAACILAPSAVMGRARQSFRRRVQTDPHLRAAVEQDLATWRDSSGTAGYGPL
jgi:hypothetical protein